MGNGPHITFEERPSYRKKTREWNVVSQGECRLGEVKWYAPWRRYCFFPDGDTLYDHICLDQISAFCLRETNSMKAERAQEKARGD